MPTVRFSTRYKMDSGCLDGRDNSAFSGLSTPTADSTVGSSDVPVASRSSPISSPLITTSSVIDQLQEHNNHNNHTNYDCQDNVEEMRGFKVFLITTQVLSLLVMFVAVLVIYINSSSAYIPITVFAYIEVIIFVFALIHACRPSIRMMLFFLALEVLNAIAMITLALVLAIRDMNKDCQQETGKDCGYFNLTIDERFYLFWFLLAKATFALFLGLIAVAHSPQMHDYMAEDEWEQAIFQG